MGFLQEIKIELLCDPEIPLLSIYTLKKKQKTKHGFEKIYGSQSS